MKSQILATYIPLEGYHITRVLCFDKHNTLVVLAKHDMPYLLDKLIDGIVVNTTSLDFKAKNDIERIRRKSFFKIGDYLGVFFPDSSIQFIDSVSLNVVDTLYPSNELPTQYCNKTLNPFLASFYLNTNELIVGLEDYGKIGYPPRYLVKLVFQDDRFTWGKPEPLPLSKYPKTYFIENSLNSDDWLNIDALIAKNNSCYIHTTGGGITRQKSGQRFEFSIVSKFDQNLDWQDNYVIEDGLGIFSSDERYFVIRSKHKTGKLFFYDTDDFTLKFNISFTPKQNLGIQKKKHLQFDLYHDRLFVFHTKFLNICELMNAGDLVT